MNLFGVFLWPRVPESTAHCWLSERSVRVLCARKCTETQQKQGVSLNKINANFQIVFSCHESVRCFFVAQGARIDRSLLAEFCALLNITLPVLINKKTPSPPTELQQISKLSVPVLIIFSGSGAPHTPTPGYSTRCFFVAQGARVDRSLLAE